MSGFVNHIKQYDDEIVNRSGINKIIDKNKILQEMIIKASTNVKDTFMIFNNNLKNLEKIINKVFENSLQIQEIADKINVLSINAAIESARSGIYGKGFKVISDEIKKLSGNTFNFLKEINNTVMESRNVLENINLDFAGREKELIKTINDQDMFAGGCYNIFENYYNNFYDIYNQFQLFTEILSEKIEKISPVLQIHEITIQEIENLTKIVNDLINDNLNQINKINNQNIEFNEKDILAFIEKIRNRLTTSREFESLKKAISDKGLKLDIDLKIDTKEIEFF
jgi:methyl-accepting chemotaxis protein